MSEDRRGQPARRLDQLRGRLDQLRGAATARRDARLVERSGYLDPEWYRRTNPDVAGGGREPARHYLRHGSREGRNPGPLFDGAWYLAQNPDVARRHADPLVHFVRFGRPEGRRARSLVVPAPPGHENVVVEQPATAASPPGSVAVMVHAYYPDTFDEICQALQAVPFPFTLLVSTPTDGASRSALASIHRHRLPATPQVRVVENRGRNFAPLVAGFAAEIASHDYLLHLHTKRSLFTGSEQAGWRDQLVDSLVGSPAVVTATLHLLAEGAGRPGAGGAKTPIGLAFPTTAATMPYWAHHWLGNAALAPGLFARLGVGEYPDGGYFEYPVGGMFWAKVDAIRPLLEAGFGFDDFPVEAGQTDGTLAHAIERCFVPLVRSRGYGFVELDRDSGAFQLGWGSRNLDQYRDLSVEGLHRSIEAARIVSFDLFDTVLTRRASRPDSVIRLAGQRLGGHPAAAEEFFAARRQGEQDARARRRWAGDVALPEIYREMAGTGSSDTGGLSRAMAVELADDLAVSVPRTVVAEAVRYASALGKRVVGISDTYFERSHVEQLLARAGVSDCFDELYLSSEQQARKDRGDLWDLVLQQEAVPVDQWLHVGDNERSDIQAAVDRDIGTYHCMNPTTLLGLRGIRCLAAADRDRWGTDLLLGPVTATLGNNPFLGGAEFEPVAVTEPAEVGYTILGPVAMAFLAWLVQHPARPEVDHLYFLSREGYLLRQLWERVRAAGGDDLPPSTYLLTSRRSAMAAAQALAFDADQVLRGFGFDGTVRELLAGRLGLALPAGHRFADMRLTLPDDDVAGRKVLN
ncbi:MAG TPA: rhamnan synthesis F family protein, partial [Acidimicrobiales bacterium]|nr:rhamnan synthesis F family protein [Acidimicrobiales bacterium]